MPLQPPELAGRPGQRSATQHMNMQVIDRLSAICACVDDRSIAVDQTELVSEQVSGDEQVSE